MLLLFAIARIVVFLVRVAMEARLVVNVNAAFENALVDVDVDVDVNVNKDGDERDIALEKKFAN